MTEQLSPIGQINELAERVDDLPDLGIEVVRLQYADLHGICRGKDIPAGAFEHAVREGIGFVEAIMTVDLRHNVVSGFERGFPDIVARPDLSTLARLPWQPEVAACIVDLFEAGGNEPSPLDPRGALKRMLGEFAGLGLYPVVGPELGFYLFEPDSS